MEYLEEKMNDIFLGFLIFDWLFSVLLNAHKIYLMMIVPPTSMPPCASYAFDTLLLALSALNLLDNEFLALAWKSPLALA